MSIIFLLKQEKILKSMKEEQIFQPKNTHHINYFCKREAGIVQQESTHSKLCILDFIYLYCNLLT